MCLATDTTLLDAVRVLEEDEARRVLLQQFHSRTLRLEGQGPRQDGTPLYWSCCYGMRDIVELMLSFGAHVNSKTRWRATSLHAAADNGHTNIARWVNIYFSIFYQFSVLLK